MQTFYIKTLGCKLNQYDSQVIEELLCGQDLARKNEYKSADLVIINTCTVTSRGDYEARRLMRKIKRENPNCLLVVTGCYAQRVPEEIGQMEEVDLVLGNKDKNQIHEIIEVLSTKRVSMVLHRPFTGGEKAAFYPIKGFSGHTRVFLKIQEGCNYRCSYCIVPSVRGKSRSVSAPKVISAISGLLDKGFKEIVLTGIDIGNWKQPGSEKKGLLYLLEQIVKINDTFRIRLSSIEPKEINEELLSFISSSDKIVPHLHIPLQSGSDSVLKAMNRPYKREYFYQLIKGIKAKIPFVCLGSDVIVGFPGEGEEEFKETYELIQSLPFSYLHVFPFSPRAETPAAHLKQTTPNRIITNRAKMLRQLSAEKNLQFRASFKGKVRSFLVLTKAKSEGRLLALSDNYIKISFEGDEKLKNRIIPIKITEASRKETFGEYVSESVNYNVQSSFKR